MKISSYLKKSPVFRFINISKILENGISSDLSKYQLSYFQALVLVALSQEGRNNILLKDLAHTFPLSKAALSQIISLLEEQKLLARKAGPDKRSSCLLITEKGTGLALKLMSTLEMKEQEFDDLINIGELDRLERHLKVAGEVNIIP